MGLGRLLENLGTWEPHMQSGPRPKAQALPMIAAMWKAKEEEGETSSSGHGSEADDEDEEAKK